MIRIVLLTLALLPMAAAAEMYKWVDEKGHTVYSEQPPPDGKAKKIDIRPSPAGTGEAPTDWKQKEMDARQTRITKEQQEESKKAVEQNAAGARRNNCLESQRQRQQYDPDHGSSSLSVRHLADPPAFMNSESGVCTTSNPCRARDFTNPAVAWFTTTVASMLTALHANASASSSLIAMRLAAGMRRSIDSREASSNAGG